MRALVTGGAGFIGSHLVQRLVDGGHNVLTFDALTYAANPVSLAGLSGNPRHALVHADIRDEGAVRAAFVDFQPSVVFHLAAETHVDRSIDDSSAFIDTNVLGAWQVLDQATRYWSGLSANAAAEFRYIQASTDEVFGSLADDRALFTLRSPYDPSSPYAASKAAADHFARGFHRTYGLPVIVSIACNTYGPRQFPEKLIPLTILNALHDEPIRVYGDGRNVRDWIHVTDHVAALERMAILARPGSTYLVSARCERRNIDVVRALCGAVGALTARPTNHPADALIEFVADRPGHDLRYALDPSQTMSELDWHPDVAFDSGLQDTVRWYLENREWWVSARARYRGERLGAGRRA